AARRVDDPFAFGAPAVQIEWADEHDPPLQSAKTAMESLIERLRPDAIVVHSALDAGVLSAARGASRMVVHLHDHRAFCPNGDRVYPRGGHICAKPMGTACVVHSLTNGCAYGPRLRTLKLIARRHLVRDRIAAADRIVVLSDYMVRLAVLNGCAPNRILILDPPLADDAFRDQPFEQPIANQILFIGRVVPQKGLRSLIRALAKVNDSTRPHLQIAGEGPELAAALADAAALRVRVTTLGALDAAGIRDAIDGARMVVMPSLWGEPFGLVGIESLARGRPVVAYDSGAINEWLGEAGRLVPRGDEPALARAIESLADEVIWKAAATKGREASARYDLQRHIERLMELYGTPRAL
ncbi:MAG: glycosyltransferase family 4 protein, partial [Candidatus Eremiobacteraeota bacterium]|nr:glycosyltransferase family 4 protein [Candidatus Eremiobacteraeota bacterium]